MSDESSADAGTESVQESFISHLIELRDRLIRSLLVIAALFGILCIYPGAGLGKYILYLPKLV